MHDPREFAVVLGSCAVNAGGSRSRGWAARRLTPACSAIRPITVSNQIIDQLTREGVSTIGVVREPEATPRRCPGIMIDGTGERMIDDLPRQAHR